MTEKFFKWDSPLKKEPEKSLEDMSEEELKIAYKDALEEVTLLEKNSLMETDKRDEVHAKKLEEYVTKLEKEFGKRDINVMDMAV